MTSVAAFASVFSPATISASPIGEPLSSPQQAEGYPAGSFMTMTNNFPHLKHLSGYQMRLLVFSIVQYMGDDAWFAQAIDCALDILEERAASIASSPRS